MTENSAVREQVQATSTWNINVPINFFASAFYHTPTGKLVRMPVEVAGDNITLQSQETLQPR